MVGRKTRDETRCLVIVLAMCAMPAATGGCNGRQPMSPTPVPAPVQPAGALTVSGTVRDEAGTPIAGARVTSEGRSPVVTDQSGRYELTAEDNALMSLLAEADGFERNEQLARPGHGTVFDLRMRHVVRMVAGEAMTLDVGPTDSLYGFDLEYRARVIRLTAPLRGLVEVELRERPDATGSPLGLSLGTASPLPGFPCCPGILASSISESGELEIKVLVPWTVTHAESFTLISRFSPR